MSLNKREKILLIVLAIIAVVAAVHYLGYRPLQKALAEAEQQLAEKQQRLAELKKLQQQEERIDVQIQELQLVLSEFNASLLGTGTSPQLVMYLAETERISGVDLLSIIPGEGSASITVEGRYPNLMSFIEGLETLENIYQARSVDMSQGDDVLLCSIAAKFKNIEISDDIHALYKSYIQNVRFGKNNPFVLWTR